MLSQVVYNVPLQWELIKIFSGFYNTVSIKIRALMMVREISRIMIETVRTFEISRKFSRISRHTRRYHMQFGLWFSQAVLHFFFFAAACPLLPLPFSRYIGANLISLSAKASWFRSRSRPRSGVSIICHAPVWPAFGKINVIKPRSGAT